MEIIDEAENEIFNTNLELGYLINDIKTIHHDKVDEVKIKECKSKNEVDNIEIKYE